MKTRDIASQITATRKYCKNKAQIGSVASLLIVPVEGLWYLIQIRVKGDSPSMKHVETARGQHIFRVQIQSFIC